MTDIITEQGADTVEDKPKVYVIVESGWKGGDRAGNLMLSDGTVLWGHCSSTLDWLKRDLTIGFSDRRDALTVRYPDGFDVVVVDLVAGDEPPDEIAQFFTLTDEPEAQP